jgi:hypothetical protein
MNMHQIDMTPEESETMEWCFAGLTEEQIEDCFTEAAEIAGAELNQDEAAELLVRLYTRLIIRKIRAEREREDQ